MKTIFHDYRGRTIHQRVDGYWDGMALARAEGKSLYKYLTNPKNRKFIDELAERHGTIFEGLVDGAIEQEDIIWIHPEVALHFTSWVGKWMRDWLDARMAETMTSRATLLEVALANQKAIAEVQETLRGMSATLAEIMSRLDRK